MYYGILKTAASSGADNELLCQFVAPLSVVSLSPSFVSDTLSLRRLASRQSAQRWEIEARLLLDSDPSSFFLHNTVAGHSETVYVRMPQLHGKPSLPNSLAITVAYAAAADATSVRLTGYLTNTIPAGEFIRFTGDSKVYVVRSHITDTITIFPPLLSPKTVGTIMSYGGAVVMNAVYDTNTRSGITFSDGVMTDVGIIKLVERL